MKIDKKRLFLAIREELCIVLTFVIIAVLIVIPLALTFLTNSFWWLLLYPAVIFIGGVCEKYNGR